VRAYWNQQWHYGQAEAMLERKWPHKYNGMGHLSWRGRLYGSGLRAPIFRGWRVYHGTWGSGLFQSLYGTAPGRLSSMLLMPEWYLLMAALAGLSLLGLVWPPLLVSVPLLGLGLGALVLQAIVSASQASFPSQPQSPVARLKAYALTAFLHLIQPMARLGGRLRHGLTPWRRRGGPLFALPRLRVNSIWSERWQPPEKWLKTLEQALRSQGALVEVGGGFDRWDLAVRGGPFGSVLVGMVSEEHGRGRQMFRLRSWPRCSLAMLLSVPVFSLLAIAAVVDRAWLAGAILLMFALVLTMSTLADCATATAAYLTALQQLKREMERPVQRGSTLSRVRRTIESTRSRAKGTRARAGTDTHTLRRRAAALTTTGEREQKRC
jgi:hypothetical protein